MVAFPTPAPINAPLLILKGIITQSPIILKTILPLFILLVAVTVAKIGYQIYRFLVISKAGMQEIDKMSGTDFELFLMSLFSKLGYHADHVGHTGDYGVDLVIEKNGIRTAVQAKRWNSNVGELAVSSTVAGIKMHNCTNAIVVTNSFYTRFAEKLAKANNVTLWDRNTLAKNIILSKKQNTV